MAKNYRTNGSAAYDVHAVRSNTARPLQKPQRLPDAPAKEAPRRAERAKLIVSPVAVLGTIAVAALLLVALFSYIGLYEAQSEAADLAEQLSELQEEQAFLQSKYEQSIDMQFIEQRAKELGLRQPVASQTVYLSVAPLDGAEVFLEPKQRNFFEKIYDALAGAFSDALEYFS